MKVYSISAQNGYGKSSCWPWQHAGESPTYIFHKDKTWNTREQFFVKLSINHIVGLVPKTYYKYKYPVRDIGDCYNVQRGGIRST